MALQLTEQFVPRPVNDKERLRKSLKRQSTEEDFPVCVFCYDFHVDCFKLEINVIFE